MADAAAASASWNPAACDGLIGLAVLAVVAAIAVEWAREQRQARAPVQTAP